MIYYCFLGNTPALSLLEMEYLGFSPIEYSHQIVTLDTKPDKIDTLTFRAGGITKIAKSITTTNEDDLVSTLTKLLTDSPTKNVVVSDEADTQITQEDLSNIKKQIKKTRSIRFLSMKLSNHSLVPIKKQHALELSILRNADHLVIAETIWIHDFNGWTARDRRKPYRDIKRGMMPPKLARIMINLATNPNTTHIVDPFCGTGTIALESLLLGYSVYASDNRKQAIGGTKENIEWLRSKQEIPGNSDVIFADATHLDQMITTATAIVTEPFMGPLIEFRDGTLRSGGKPVRREKIKNIIKGLDKLYKGVLKSWYKILIKKGRVVMIIPEFHIYDQKMVIPLIDTCENLGYNKLAQIPYSKPGASLIRNIMVLEKNGTHKTIR